MKPSDKQITDFIQQSRPRFEQDGEPKLLSGGNLNYVWQVPGKSESLIVKHAPPHIASSPDIPLNPNRLEFEARALQLFLPEGRCSDLAADNIRPPVLYGFDKSQYLLLMEDISPAQPWFECLKNGTMPVNSAGEVGLFIGKLHGRTYRDKSLAKTFSNRPIQQTRLTVQYQSAEENLLAAGFDDVAQASKNAIELGEELMNPGKCLIMGDLWPPSILVQNGKFRVIDWEFSHFGRPLQDLAHFGAHCYMHSIFTDKDDHLFKTTWSSFLKGYRDGARDSYEYLMDEDEKKRLPVHFGAEILVRTAGPFREGYLFSDLSSDNQILQRALEKSFQLLNRPEDFTLPEELFK